VGVFAPSTVRTAQVPIWRLLDCVLATKYDRHQVHSNFTAAVLALPLALVIGLGGCAKSKHVAPRLPPTPGGAETGIASWYGDPYHGRAAANGEIYDMEKMTAAHRTLPFGSWVRVTNLTNNKTVDVRITDRGPFIDGRIIDLSRAAARAIDLIGPGIAQVRLEIIPAPIGTSTPALYAIQVGAFQDRDRAERLRDSMVEQFMPARIVLQAGVPNVWRVLVGGTGNLDDANLLAARVRAKIGECLVVRLDDAPADAVR